LSPLLIIAVAVLSALVYVCIRTYRLIKHAKEQRAEVAVDAYGTDVYIRSDLALSGPPTEGANAFELATNPIEHRRNPTNPTNPSVAAIRTRDADWFASPPLTVLSTGEARVATSKVEHAMRTPCDAPCTTPCTTPCNARFH